MRRPLLLLALLAALAVGGCGGNEIKADEVAVDPPALPIPDAEAAAPDAQPAAGKDAADEDDPDDADDADADATPDATGGGGSTGGGGNAGGGGTTAAPQPTATPAPTQAPADPGQTGGADADQGLDQFCQDNPGAC